MIRFFLILFLTISISGCASTLSCQRTKLTLWHKQGVSDFKYRASFRCYHQDGTHVDHHVLRSRAKIEAP